MPECIGEMELLNRNTLFYLGKSVRWRMLCQMMSVAVGPARVSI